MAKTHSKWRVAKKILTWLFFIAVVVLLVVYARKVNWEEVYNVVINYNRFCHSQRRWAGDCQLSYLRHLRPDWPGLLWPQAGKKSGHAGVVYLLCL